MKCSRCGSELKDTDTICLNCGNIIEPSDNQENDNFDKELEGLLDSYKNDKWFEKDSFDEIGLDYSNFNSGPDYSSFNDMNENPNSQQVNNFGPIDPDSTNAYVANANANNMSKPEDLVTFSNNSMNTVPNNVSSTPNEDPLYIENTSTFNPISMDDTGVFEAVAYDSSDSNMNQAPAEPVIEPVYQSSYEEGIPEIVSSPKSHDSDIYNQSYYENGNSSKKGKAKKKKKEPVSDDYQTDTYNSDVVFDDGNTDKKSILDYIPFKTLFIIAAVILLIIVGVLVYRISSTKPKSTSFDSNTKKEQEEKSKYSLTENPNYIKDRTWVCGTQAADGSLGNDYSTYFQYDFYKNGSYATKSVKRDDDYEDGTYSISLEEISDSGYLYKITLVANLNGGYKTKYFFTLNTNKEGTKAIYKINGSTYACEEMDYFNNK